MLLCKNVIVNGRRTSMRLDAEMWHALKEISERESITVSEICSKIDDLRGENGLSASIRLFILTYFRFLLSKYEKKASNKDSGFLDIL